jgi:hypothetical protein
MHYSTVEHNQAALSTAQVQCRLCTQSERTADATPLPQATPREHTAIDRVEAPHDARTYLNTS